MIIQYLGIIDYLHLYKKMKDFTQKRDENTKNEIWICEHYPVFTQGVAGKQEHILSTDKNIPVIHTDRGGQVTYHGPGQLMIYPLLNLKKSLNNPNPIGVRDLVSLLEMATIKFLKRFEIESYSKPEAPGVYVNQNNETRKIASIGIRIHKHCSYHGIGININTDLLPFGMINPCGYSDLKMTSLSALGIHIDMEQASQALLENLIIGLQ